MADTERTLLLVKPDGVQRGLIGRILTRIEEKKLTIEGLRMLTVDRAAAESLYGIHKERPFYGELIGYISSGPIVAVALSGIHTVTVVRNLVGATFGREAAAGTIRGDFALEDSFNLVHASDSPENAARELGLFFPS